MNIILGSTSPRRKAILGALFSKFIIVPPSVEENHRARETPLEFALRMSEEKCRSIGISGAIADYPALIISSDTIVTIDGVIIGKPADHDDAVRIISLLSGRIHRVITGLTLFAPGGPRAPFRPFTAGEATEVTFRSLDRAGIERYLASIEYLDKAGAYAFQDNGAMIIDHYRGSVTNIIGFPLRLFFAMLSERGLLAPAFMDMPEYD